MKRFLISLLGLTFALAITGCTKRKDEDVLDDTDRPKVVFEGTADAKYSGTWKTEDRISVYKLAADGGYVLDSNIPMKGSSPMKTHSIGNWAVNADHLLFKDAQGNVASYLYELKGQRLTLTTSGTLKGKTIMDRQK